MFKKNVYKGYKKKKKRIKRWCWNYFSTQLHRMLKNFFVTWPILAKNSPIHTRTKGQNARRSEIQEKVIDQWWNDCIALPESASATTVEMKVVTGWSQWITSHLAGNSHLQPLGLISIFVQHISSFSKHLSHKKFKLYKGRSHLISSSSVTPHSVVSTTANQMHHLFRCWVHSSSSLTSSAWRRLLVGTSPPMRPEAVLKRLMGELPSVMRVDFSPSACSIFTCVNTHRHMCSRSNIGRWSKAILNTSTCTNTKAYLVIWSNAEIQNAASLTVPLRKQPLFLEVFPFAYHQEVNVCTYTCMNTHKHTHT